MEARRPDIEFTRKIGVGFYKSYGHIYFKPLIVVLFGKRLVGKKHLKNGIKDKRPMSYERDGVLCERCGADTDLWNDVDGYKGRCLCFSCAYELQNWQLWRQKWKN